MINLKVPKDIWKKEYYKNDWNMWSIIIVDRNHYKWKSLKYGIYSRSSIISDKHNCPLFYKWYKEITSKPIFKLLSGGDLQ